MMIMMMMMTMWMLRRRRKMMMLRMMMWRRKIDPKTGKHTLRSRNVHGHFTRAILCRNLQDKCRTQIPGQAFCASLRSRNAHGHVTRGILCEIYRENMGKCRTRIPRHPFCASLRSRNTHGQVTRGILCVNLPENAGRDRYHLDWTPGLNTYRKNPSGWPQCLGNRHKRIFMTGLTSSGYLDGWTGFILLQCFYNGNMSPACHTSLICKKYTHKWVKQETSGSRHQLARKLNRYYHWFVCMLGYGDAASNAVKTLALNPEAGPGLQVIHQIHHHAGQLWVFDSHQTLVCVVRKVPTSWGTHAHSTTGKMIVWPRTPEKN